MYMPTYYHKRLFDTEWRQYVVKKHHATSLHYDFRLEHAGVLKSWAVPCGPCLDPSRKRLAVLVNDHRIEYFGFEGTIPPGRYGAGPVMLWDCGMWRTDQDVDQALRAGRLTFELRGNKLKGSWSLIRMRPLPGDNQEKWLLHKDHDTEAKSLSEIDILAAQPLSVVSGRTLAEIASAPPSSVRSRRNSKSKNPAPHQPSLFPNNFEQ